MITVINAFASLHEGIEREHYYIKIYMFQTKVGWYSDERYLK